MRPFEANENDKESDEKIQTFFIHHLYSRFFQMGSIACVLGPFLGEFTAFYMKGQQNGSLASSIFICSVNILNYLWYLKQRNIEIALKVLVCSQLLSYFWGILAGGGILAEHLVYMPLFPVVCGFLFGKRGVLWTSGYFILFCFVLVFFEKFGITRPELHLRSTSLLGLHMIVALSFLALIITLFNIVRSHTEIALEKVNVELNLERSKSLHQSKLASLGELSAGIAHEINNPVAIISTSVQLIPQLLNQPEKLQAKLNAIERSTERIAKIVSGLKKFSRSSEKSIHLPHSITEIIQETVVLTEAKAKRHFTLVEVNIQSEASILCEEVEIEQVLVNLINNGIDAVETAPEKWVRISTFEDNNSIVLQIRDSGNGIPKEVRAKLFQPFHTTKPVGKGTGLGLSIVKGILDEHRASIEVLENECHTCFEIRFPKIES